MSDAAPGTKPRPVMSTERTRTLVDGVVAIVITLIVLGIEVPKGLKLGGPDVREFLSKIAHALHPYLGSFLLVATYWIQHSAIFHYLKRGNRTFVWLNLLFLFPVTLIPFVNELRIQYPTEPVALSLFAAVHLGCEGSLLLLWAYATRGFRLVSPRLLPEVSLSMRRRMLVGCAVIVAASMVSALNEYVATAVIAIMPTLYFSHREVDSHWAEG